MFCWNSAKGGFTTNFVFGLKTAITIGCRSARGPCWDALDLIAALPATLRRLFAEAGLAFAGSAEHGQVW